MTALKLFNSNEMSAPILRQLPLGKTQNLFIEPKNSFTTTVVQQQTIVEGNTSSSEIIGSNEHILPQSLQLASVETIKKVEATVGEIDPTSVTIHCKTSFKDVDIKLPISLVPDELRNYGMPVYVSLDSATGVRIPLIEKRSIGPQPDLDGIDEVQAWLNKR